MTQARSSFYRIRPWLLAILYIATCGLYFFYWYYNATKKLYTHRGIPVQALWRTIGLIVPLLNIYLLWVLFRDIKKFAAAEGLHPLEFPGLMTIAFLVSTGLYRLPGLFCFLGLLSVIPTLWTQRALNSYWEKVLPNAPEKRRLNWIEIILCLTGSAILIMSVMGIGLNPAAK